jgi:rhomboid family GlyGly-CTERM serine protease
VFFVSRQALAIEIRATLRIAGIAALILVGAQLVGIEVLQYQRERVLEGQLWRLLSAHAVHLGWRHSLLNLLALVLILAIFPDSLRRGAAVWLIFASLAAIDGGLLLRPEILWYVGLSGVLHGLLAGACVLTARRREGRVLLLLLGAKLLWEQRYGALPSTATIAGGPVLVDAHLFGAIGGLVCAGMVLLRRRQRQAL